MTVCQGTKRDGGPCTASATAGECYCYNHPDYAEERKRGASRAATAKHSSVGRELRAMRELIWDLLNILLSDENSLTESARNSRTSCSSCSATSGPQSLRCGRQKSPCRRTWT